REIRLAGGLCHNRRRYRYCGGIAGNRSRTGSAPSVHVVLYVGIEWPLREVCIDVALLLQQHKRPAFVGPASRSHGKHMGDDTKAVSLDRVPHIGKYFPVIQAGCWGMILASR